jgi:hypothetical protein
MLGQPAGATDWASDRLPESGSDLIAPGGLDLEHARTSTARPTVAWVDRAWRSAAERPGHAAPGRAISAKRASVSALPTSVGLPDGAASGLAVSAVAG